MGGKQGDDFESDGLRDDLQGTGPSGPHKVSGGVAQYLHVHRFSWLLDSVTPSEVQILRQQKFVLAV